MVPMPAHDNGCVTDRIVLCADFCRSLRWACRRIADLRPAPSLPPKADRAGASGKSTTGRTIPHVIGTAAPGLSSVRTGRPMGSSRLLPKICCLSRFTPRDTLRKLGVCPIAVKVMHTNQSRANASPESPRRISQNAVPRKCATGRSDLRLDKPSNWIDGMKRVCGSNPPQEPEGKSFVRS
jgi:hypothetical protein